MTSIIEQFILLKQILRKEDKIIVAVSGGIDSMVLLTLLYQLGYTIVVAHCNFGLRGEASDLDEALVKSYCQKLEVKFYSKKFKETADLKDSKIGIQELARTLRYNWFEQLLVEIGYNKIATAHHLDDQLETVLFNLIRGTGLNGIRGIAVKKDNLIRPLLCFDKSAIHQIAEENDIPYRTDSSNLEDQYTRNKIRHKVLPVLKEINKNAALHAQELSEWAAYFVSADPTFEPLYNIDLNAIKNQQFPAQFLLHQLGFFGFNKYQIEDLLKHIYLGKYGNAFYSAQYKLFVNKNQIEIIENSVRNSFSISIESLPYNASMNELNLSIELVNHPIELKQANTFYIGLQTIELPIKINTINAGDLIQPYGMKGHKTIGNYFTDKKLSHKLREKAFKLIVNDQIAALIPYCIDQKFAVTEESKFILKIAIKKA